MKSFFSTEILHKLQLLERPLPLQSSAATVAGSELETLRVSSWIFASLRCMYVGLGTIPMWLYTSNVRDSRQAHVTTLKQELTTSKKELTRTSSETKKELAAIKQELDVTNQQLAANTEELAANTQRLDQILAALKSESISV